MSVFSNKKLVELIKYVLIGVATTLLDIAVYYLLAHIFSLQYMISNTLAFITATIFAFFANKFLVFESKTLDKKQLLSEVVGFFTARISTGVMNSAIMWLGIDALRIYDLAVKIFANVSVIIANYLLSKFFVFNKKNQTLNGESDGKHN